MDEDIADQGFRFDLTTLLSRRVALSALGLGVGAFALAACSPSDMVPVPRRGLIPPEAPVLPSGEIPEEMAGPFPADGSNGPDVLERSGIVRGDIRSSLEDGATAQGVPLTFRITVLDMANGDAPLSGAAIYAWHCDAQGGYSMYSSGIEGESYLRGVQVTDSSGSVTFASIFPGCYPGRWPHIHFEVYSDLAATSDSENALATSQLALSEESSLAVYDSSGYTGSARNLAEITLGDDLVFRDDRGELQLAVMSGSIDAGYTATLVARVDSSTPAGAATASR